MTSSSLLEKDPGRNKIPYGWPAPERDLRYSFRSNAIRGMLGLAGGAIVTGVVGVGMLYLLQNLAR